MNRATRSARAGAGLSGPTKGPSALQLTKCGSIDVIRIGNKLRFNERLEYEVIVLSTYPARCKLNQK